MRNVPNKRVHRLTVNVMMCEIYQKKYNAIHFPGRTGSSHLYMRRIFNINSCSGALTMISRSTCRLRVSESKGSSSKTSIYCAVNW
jgi:hypothetical protein